MKNFVLIIPIIILFSCSEQLNKEEASKLIKSCPTYNKDILETVKFGTQITTINSSYRKLRDEGMISIDSTLRFKSKFNNYESYNYIVNFTSKGREYVVNTGIDPLSVLRKKGSDSIAEVRVAKLRLLSIDEILEVPNENKAEVRVTMLQEDLTPFKHLMTARERNRDTIKINKPIIFRKTNDGWKVCKE